MTLWENGGPEPPVAASPLVGELGVVGKRVSFLLPVATLLPGSSEGIFSSDHPLVGNPQRPWVAPGGITGVQRWS